MDPLPKTKKELKNLKKQELQASYIYKNEIDKVCFQYDMAYGNFKELKRRTASDKILRDKAFNIAKNPKYDGCQRGVASMFYNFFDKKSTSLTDKSVAGGGVANNEIKQNLQLANELHKLISRKFILDLMIIFGLLI